MKIGLLEDNPAIIDYMKAALELAGHEVVAYTHGEALLQTFLPGGEIRSLLPHDLVIIDILLPGELSGTRTIAQLRQWFPSDALPIIVVSACSKEDLLKIQTLFPEVLTLRKPFKINVLLQMIAQASGH